LRPFSPLWSLPKRKKQCDGQKNQSCSGGRRQRQRNGFLPVGVGDVVSSCECCAVWTHRHYTL